MSMESLLADEPTVTLQRLAQPGATDAAGLPVAGLIVIRQVIGRLTVNSARQKEMWMGLGVEADYEFLSQDGAIVMGDFLLSFIPGQGAEQRLFRVNGSRSYEYPKGNIPGSFLYPLIEEMTS